MDNDDKLTSHGEDTLPGDDAKAKAAQNDSAAGDKSTHARRAAAEAELRASNTISFPRMAHVGASGRIEPNFGVPDFDLPDQTHSRALGDGFSGAESATMSIKNGLDMPLQDGTGWDSVGRIEAPLSVRAWNDSVEPGAETVLAAQRGEANIMPFPGAAVPRSTEPTPSDMLRGMGESGGRDLFAPHPEDLAEQAPDFDLAGEDALADAVQSALRNVYGGQPVERGEEAPDLGGLTVAESLMHAASERPPSDASWPENSDAWPSERNDDYYETEHEPAGAEANTEAVLDYLYGQRRAERRRDTVLSADSSLRDFGDASGYSQEWQDGPEFEDRFASSGALRDFGDSAYRGGSQRFADPGDRVFLREREGPYRGEPADEVDWGQPPFLPQSSSHSMGGQAYPISAPSAAPESLSAGTPDSGHLLGAAGLGLIGGIALAGVLAVFVFNSFVDENDPGIADVTPKVVERLALPQADRQSQPSPAATAPQRQSASSPAEPAPVAESPRPAPLPAATGQRLLAQNVSGVAGDPIPLDIKVADAADRDETLVSLKGLPAQAKLSTGIDVGGGQWLLPPARLRDLTVSLPKGGAGEYALEAQLLKDDAQTSLSEPVAFRLKVNDRAPQQGNSGQGGPASTSANPEQVARLAVLPDETLQIETDFVTQMLIRDGNRLMRDGDIAAARRLYEQAAASGNAEAALALGRSFDPSYFEKLPVKTGKPDPATAFEWYKKALEGGLVTARVKIDALKQWLQR